MIFRYLSPREEWPAAATCSEWYQLLKERRLRIRGEQRWHTSAVPFLFSDERVEWMLRISPSRDDAEALQHQATDSPDSTHAEMQKCLETLQALSDKACASHGLLRQFVTMDHVMAIVGEHGCDTSCSAVLAAREQTRFVTCGSATPWPLALATIASAAGDKSTLQLLLANGFTPTTEMAAAAAANGHQNVLITLANHGLEFDVTVRIAAAAHGQTRTLDWMKPTYFPHFEEFFTRDVAVAAARGGHMECLEYICLEDPSVLAPECVVAAAGQRDIAMLTLLRRHGCRLSYHAYEEAGTKGFVDVLDHLFDHYPMPSSMQSNYEYYPPNLAFRIAEAGQTDCLQWVYLHNFRVEPRAVCRAAVNGHLDTVRWICENIPERDVNACETAACGGHLDVLRELREQGFPWDKRTTTAAALFGHLECVQWAVQQGCPVDSMAVLAADISGHVCIADWLVTVAAIKRTHSPSDRPLPVAVTGVPSHPLPPFADLPGPIVIERIHYCRLMRQRETLLRIVKREEV